MNLVGLLFEETRDSIEVQSLNLQDPNTGFADVECHDEEAGQRWFIIKHNGTTVGYCSIVWPDNPEIFQFFICPNARRKGIGAAAGRGLVEYLLAEHQKVSLSAVTDIAYQFWKKTLEGFTCSEDGDALRVTRHPETLR